MYTIREAATRSGIPIATLRAWERRYGVVHPVRTAAGYRLYDDDAIARLRAMRRLIDGRGMRPSQAADHLLSGRMDAPADDVASAQLDDPADGTPHTGTTDVAAFIDAAGDLDITRMERILDDWFAAERFEPAMEHAVFPALRAIGAAWADGRIDPSMEHVASETVRRRIAHFFDAAASVGRGRPVVVGLPPGAHHDIGALAYGTAMRRAGLDVVYLGANVPVDSWLRAVDAAHASVAVIGAVSTSDVGQTRDVVSAIARMDVPPPIAIGGSHAAEVARDSVAAILPDDLELAVGMVRALAARTV